MTSKTEAKKTTPLTQPVENRASGADAAMLRSAATRPALKPRPASPLASAAGLGKQDLKGACSQCITMSIFFDGTGNNIDADTPSREHSNVARLFKVHHPNNDVRQVYRRYVPGIGTYFKDSGDPGGTTTGRGMGALGQSRLDWAFKELATILKKANARANNHGNKIVCGWGCPGKVRGGSKAGVGIGGGLRRQDGRHGSTIRESPSRVERRRYSASLNGSS